MKVACLLLLVCAAAAVGTCAGTPAPAAAPAPAPVPAPAARPVVRHRPRRQLDFLDNTRKLIEELISNLKKAVSQAKEAVDQFNSGVGAEAVRVRDKFARDLAQLQQRVSAAAARLQDRLATSGSAVGDCIASHRGAAAEIYQNASQQMTGCADARIKEGGELVGALGALCERGQGEAERALAEMRNCSAQHASSALGFGACLGAVAVRAEVKAAAFVVQTGLAMGRLNVFMSTLPAALEVCAGSSLVGAGLGAARVLADIGACSAHSLISTFAGPADAAAAAPAAAPASAGLVPEDANSVGAAPAAPATPESLATALSDVASITSIAADQINQLAFN